MNDILKIVFHICVSHSGPLWPGRHCTSTGQDLGTWKILEEPICSNCLTRTLGATML